MYKLNLEKAEKPEIKLPISIVSKKKQEDSRKTSMSVSLTMLKLLMVWITTNCCFLTCVQVSKKVGKLVLYSHLLKNFPQFVVIHTVKGFGIVNKTKVIFFSHFFDDPTDVGNLISGSYAFSKSSLNVWKFTLNVLLKPGLENFEH